MSGALGHTCQATSNAPGNLASVRALAAHPAFVITNPNACYSLFLGFARSPVNFHAADGTGYEYLADVVLQLDPINHQACVLSATGKWELVDSSTLYCTCTGYESLAPQLDPISHQARCSLLHGLLVCELELSEQRPVLALCWVRVSGARRAAAGSYQSLGMLSPPLPDC